MGTLMIQGTGSDVGKSFIVAGLCRLFKKEGLAVAPFKAQNMALNSFATKDGLEIGRAQATQAMAAGIQPTVSMNPILLKPTSDRRAQVIVNGKSRADMDARAYHEQKPAMMEVIAQALGLLLREYDLVIIEGAGSPAEINLMDKDIVNMAVARQVDAPVVIVADIDKGGAFAAICGTMELLPPEDRGRVRGFIINKFRGDIELLRPGLDFLEMKTGLPVLGVIPYADIPLEAEDSVSLESAGASKAALLRIAVPKLPHISNFTDFEPLQRLSAVSIDYISAAAEVGRPDAVIIPGTKNTLADLAWLRRTGIADAVCALAADGVPVIGVCGGFQMLGDRITDPLGIEGAPGSAANGLGLLPIETELAAEKQVRQVEATVSGAEAIFGDAAIGMRIKGYEIHAGLSRSSGDGRPLFMSDEGSSDGWVRDDLPVAGTYLHGLFDDRRFRGSFTDRLARAKGCAAPPDDSENFEERIEKVAGLLRRSLDIEALRAMIDSSRIEKEEIVVY